MQKLLFQLQEETPVGITCLGTRKNKGDFFFVSKQPSRDNQSKFLESAYLGSANETKAGPLRKDLLYLSFFSQRAPVCRQNNSLLASIWKGMRRYVFLVSQNCCRLSFISRSQ